MNPADSAELDRLAHERMESGIALMGGEPPEALRKALRSFEEAIALRERLPLAENPGFRYGLAAGWLGRGDVLMRLGAPENFREAASCCEKAIDLLKNVPAGDDGSWLRRLAIAWANLGDASLRTEPAAAAAARDAAERALGLLAPIESRDTGAAEVGLKARHVLCQSIGMLLAENGPGGAELFDTLTDTIEDALRVAQNLAGALLPHATQFYFLGAVAYERHQPHFLAEFLMEHLRPGGPEGVPDPARLAIAAEALARARHRLRSVDFASLATPEGIRRLEILNEVKEAEETIQALRASGRGSGCPRHARRYRLCY